MESVRINWPTRMAIGAVGGLCLSLLKLIEVDFLLLPSVLPIERWVGFLTYLSFIVLGSIVAVFFADHEVSATKQKRNALIMGLLAPSLLLAIVNKPQDRYLARYSEINQIEEVGLVSAPLLELLPISTAYADNQITSGSIAGAQIDAESASSGLIQTITEQDVILPLGQQFMCALGRCGNSAEQPYLFVVGQAADAESALAAAVAIQSRLNEYEFTNEDMSNAEIRVVHPANSDTYFVTLGGLKQRWQVRNYQTEAVQAVSREPSGSSRGMIDPKAKIVDQLIVQGQLLPAIALLH